MRDALRLQQIIKRDAREADAATQDGPQAGIVTSFDPLTQSAKVRLQPYGQETGYLPVRTQWAGPGWGLFSPPSKGDAVDVHFTAGNIDSGFISGRAHNDVDAPLPVPSGELWAVHKSGLRLTLTNDGKALLGGTLTGDGIIMLGNTADLHKIVKAAFMDLYNAHVHIDSNGHRTTNPIQPMTAAEHLTKETVAS